MVGGKRKRKKGGLFWGWGPVLFADGLGFFILGCIYI